MIIITGASKGLGRYLFATFKENDNKVIGTYNSTTDGLEDDMYYYHKVDVSNHKEVVDFIESIRTELTEIVLINCAGISYSSFAHKADINKWRRVIEVNLFGSFNMIHELLPIMRSQNYGRIINFSSVAAKYATLGLSAYAASKSALWGMSKSLAAESASKGITVNSINIGYVDLGMGVNDVPPIYQEQLKERIPAARFCTPKEIYNTVQYLIDTEYVNGTSIDINGGLI